MTPRQVLFVTLVGLGLLILVLELIRRHLLREKYSLLWFFIAVALVTVPPLYGVYQWFARRVGIRDPNTIFFFLAIVGLILLSLQFSLALSTAYYQRKQLIQQTALLENRVRRLENALSEKGSPETRGPGSPRRSDE